MGNHPSKSPGVSTYPTSAGNNQGSSGGFGGHQAHNKVNRRTSIHALSGASGGKSTAADPSASRESATGKSVSHRQQLPVQQRLQSRAIPESPRSPQVYGLGQHEQHQGFYPSNNNNNSQNIQESITSSNPEPSKAVEVPSAHHRPGEYRSVSGPPRNTYYGSSSRLQRPPRLPLPIGDATIAPGSPIMATADSQEPSISTEQAELEASSERSVLGESVADDEDLADELESYTTTKFTKTVPRLVEWRGKNEKVYVTGTFVNWERKLKLHRSELQDDLMTAIIHLRPGTHHLKYIVDGEMRTSDSLPTAVDFTNHLVNYIEVSVDEVEGNRKEKDKQLKVTIPPDIHPPRVLPESLEYEYSEDEEEPEEEIPQGDFRSVIPRFLVDIDKEEEDTANYQQAASVISESAAPPSLPQFLGKSILNSNTTAKHDNSVLKHPNHTVLNHLATSSIKNGVLATSVTTRYKRKYVTTILYKPTDTITE